MQATSSKHFKAGPLALAAALAGALALSACSDPNAALDAKIAAADAAAKRAEDAADKAEKALAKMDQSKKPEMVDGGPQLMPEQPVQQPVVEAPPQEPGQQADKE